MEEDSELNLSENAEEILEILWTLEEKEGQTRIGLDSIGVTIEEEAITDLSELNLISLSDHQVSLTPQGFSEAEKVVRRHRLAERLLVDVLDIDAALVEDAACKFEHVLREGVEDNVCILLGHPRICPHGNPIPQGPCCLKGEDKASRVVVTLSQLEPNQGGKIAYIQSRGRKRLQQLISMGVTPGSPIHVIQSFPSYVFQIGQTQIAVDDEIANDIFILRTEL